MKKLYQTPGCFVYNIVGQTHLMEPSIVVDSSDKIEDSDDIGFTKEELIDSDDFWQ